MYRNTTSTEPSFNLSADSACSWASEKPFGPMMLRQRIEPWLTALVQSEHLSLLIGSGLTHAVHHIATGKALPGMQAIPFNIFNDEISEGANQIAKAAGRDNGNFEDQIRVANELLRGLEITTSTKAETATERAQVEDLRKDLVSALDLFAVSILEAEHALASSHIEKRERAFNYLVSFLMSFASRSGTRERLHLFTTNYDRYIEAGADTAGLRVIDRFVGTDTTEPVQPDCVSALRSGQKPGAHPAR